MDNMDLTIDLRADGLDALQAKFDDALTTDPRMPYDEHATADELMRELSRRMLWLRVHRAEIAFSEHQLWMAGALQLAAALSSTVADVTASFTAARERIAEEILAGVPDATDRMIEVQDAATRLFVALDRPDWLPEALWDTAAAYEPMRVVRWMHGWSER